ncbi:Lovastatin nonaketide synthase [Fusarium oxysporum f. sp. cubense race 1]|uniref:Lovastatin nonaketide synthase n=1 Tax=Fusarium oxysporum f. sp. cubense (strain race 1) TaxID=1229664 RepID=N4TYE4_FUSC1|nr:Lovastatin nonaketide synthase [Fusarium oxysporum f. sp. cubense race 1]
MSIDTACSSSLVAVHEAVRTLRSGESNVAVAAGANLILLPGMYICESKLRMISPTGRSRMWDASADGYARGEGFASVILKTLSQALADGDPIECIIRETGVNQDGKTPGLTVPSNIAQTALIRDVYQRAGLDITKPSDRPQLFHAHGTGTKAGDPKEAEAISKAFFSDDQPGDEKLYVVSIKTQIGHTEGTAGLASLLGTMMAMKNATVPPNMHFETLNPDIEPFYSNLEVPTSAKTWPDVHGSVKRASINSFGFGGTNAHAILESYEPALHSQPIATTEAESPRLYTPLLFSANSEKALKEVLSSYLSFLEERYETNMSDLAWTLYNRRSTLPYRSSVVVPAGSVNPQEAARSAILAEIERLTDSTHKLHRSSSVATPKILGVFSGQGAQWPRMGAVLLESSSWARDRIAELDGYLAELPASDAPDFTLESELLAFKETSRVAEAAISQPLCTAVQVLLVDLIRELAGIQLSAVVGHSSGEIAAAYAAGFMTRRAAIVTAYYRGRYAKLAASPSSSDIKGAMAAVGTDEADALEFCALEDNTGRITVAAVNAPSSVTLSGDEDAIEEAIAVFQDEGKFARRLKVDTAYHSSHMQAAAGPYLEALQRNGVHFDEQVASKQRPLWFSSTKVDAAPMKRENLSPQYWIDNMVKPVMFAPALDCALAHSGPFDMALELGPHPALKGPALESLGSGTPYHGVLTRGKDDVESVADCFGAVWRNLGRGHVNFASIDATLSCRSSTHTAVRDLPSYPFTADSQVFWSESRFCAALRQMDEPVHPILGRRMVENSVPGMTQWRNILRAREIPWLRGHRLQGQVIFPGCGYAAMALEAAMILVRGLKDSPTVRLLSLYDLTMDQAIVFNDDSSSVETLVTMKTVESSHDELVVDFVCCSYHTHGLAPAVTSTHAHGRVVARLGAPSADAIPGQTAQDPARQFNLAPIEIDRFYTELAKHGYQYSPPFKGIVEIERKSDFAIGKIVDQSGPEWEDQVALAHPGLMDSGVQTVLAAMAAPGDGRLWCLQMLVGIDAIHVNPYFASAARGAIMAWEASTTLGEDADSLGEAVGDMKMLSPDGQQAYIAVEGARMRPFTPATAANDSPLFSTWVYGPSEPDGVLASRVNRPQEVADAEIRSADNLDRLSLFYVRRLAELIPAGSKARDEAQEHFKRLLTWCDHVIGLVSRGEHHFLTPEMMNDTQAEVDRLLAEYANSNDFRLTHAAAKALLEVVPANEGNVHEYLTKDNMLNRYYEETLRYEASDQKMYNMMRQLAHIYPQMRVLEVGAGTGGATSHALPAIDGAFSVYTFTDISTAFFDKAEEKFKDYSGRINFKALDMNNSIEEQGFTESSYHVVMAGMALHATGDVEGALRNIRRLLKPGGRLIGFENINNDAVRLGIGMGGFAAWWSGAEYGRPWGPMLTLEQWDDALKRTGFTGVDTHTVGHNQTQPMCLWVSMARDEKVDLLREPLTVVPEKQQSLVVVGGKSLGTMDLVEKTKSLVAPFYQTTSHFRSIEALNDITEDQFPEGSSVLCLTELDEPVLRTVTDPKLDATTPQDLTVALPAGASEDLSSMALLSTAAHLVAAQIAALVPQQKGSHIVIHEADPLVRTAIMNLFESHPAPSWRVSFTGCLIEGQQPQDLPGKTTWLAQELSSRAIRKALPALTSSSLLVDFSAPNSPSSIIASVMADCLPWYARTEKSLIRNRVEVRPGDLADAKAALQAAWSKASSMVIEARDREAIPLSHIEGFTAPTGQSLHLVDWATPSVPVRVHPLDHHTNIFRSDKTYLLVGLSGEMGQSCCEWMAAHGARYVVLTSRYPKVDQRFIDNMEQAGVTVVPRKLDITSKESLHLCYQAITRTLPPIAGVANGAMLLQDVLFKDMDAANLNKVLAPKVNGSIYLDELLADTKLDFFLMFSSAASIVGSRGQANYAAANMFMASLVNNRRKRGLAASIINISALIGLGYIERQKIYDASFFKDIGIANTSAQGLHQLIAEAILAGQRFGPDEDIEGGEISQGIMPQFSDDEHKSFFIHDSKFSNMLIERVGGDADADASGNAAAVSLSRQLKRVTSKDQALRVITDAFVPAETDVPESLALVDQGVDSLVAVDVRSWFLKELDTDMPVLKILGGNSILDLASDALERIPKALLDLDRDDDEASNAGQPLSGKKLPETSTSSSSSDVVTGDSDAVSQSSATDVSTTAKSTAGADTASIPPSLSNMKNNNGSDDRHKRELEDEAARKRHEHEEAAAKRREEIVKSSSEIVDEMSLVQSRFWFLTTALEDKTTFNVTISAHLKGRVDVGKLERALEGVAKRHEILRTRFFFGGKSLETPMQGVLSKPTVHLTSRHITNKADVEQEMEWLHSHPWNLGDWETIKLSLLSQSDTEHWLVLAFHHIAFDGYSLEIFWRDLAKAYNANGSIPTLPDAKQYRAYIAKQRQQNLSKPFEWRKAIEYYRKLIMPEPEPLPLLPFAKVSHRKLLENYSCYNAEIALEPSEAARIRKLAKANHSTSFHVYVAALQTLLFGLMPDSIDRLFVAMDDTNRLDKDFMDTIGLFVNTLFLRFDRTDYNKLSFSDAVKAARTKTYKALEHSVLPLDVLLKELCITRHGDAVPVAQVLIDYRVSHKEWFRLGDCRAEMGTGRAERQGSDLAFYILDDSDEQNGGSVRVGVEVQSTLYDGEHAEMLIRAYTNLLRKVTADEAGSKMALKSLPPWNEDDLSISLGPTIDAWPNADTLSHRIEEMIRENPSAPALDDETSQLSYEQMGRRIDEIASSLTSAGLSENDFIGVFQETGVDWICSMLAILKLGMTYVPLYPPIGMPRLAANVQVAQPQAVLVDNSTADNFDQLGTQSAQMIHVPVAGSSTAEVPIRAQPDQRAMILCTSGSTGIPKAVIHTNRSLKALVEPHAIVQEQDKPSYAARVLQQSAFSFDLSIDQTMLALCNGGCVFVVPNSKRGDPLGTVDMIARHKITYTMCTPSEYSIWYRFARDPLLNCTAWENASSSGGPLSTALVRAFAGLELPHLRVFNHCGPTETTVTNRVELDFNDYAEGEKAQMRYVTDVGFPCANYSTYIVDENMKLVPRGYPGEIVVGGAGVADGYLGRPDLTKEKFMPDPWTSSKQWKIMYRTGDRGKLRANGMVDILGRIEGGTQVKLRGYRIELGDVESAILSAAHGVLSDAVVTLRYPEDRHEDHDDDGFLVAHVVVADKSLRRPEVESFLRKIISKLPLPHYMLPALMMPIDRFPLTAHQKPDRNAIAALPLPAFTPATANDAAVEEGSLESETQKKIAKMWRTLVPASASAAITADTDFFHVGGSSLLLIKLQGMIRKEFNVSLRLLNLMAASKLREMAALVNDEVSGGDIDWQRETKIPDEWLSLPQVASQKADGSLRVLVTGATGFLGRNLMSHLAESPQVSEIHCLVRDASITDPSDKVTLWRGDLSQPNLGLSDTDFTRLSNSVDAIIHCGANRSFWDDYRSLRAVNVTSVAELVRLALPRRLPVHVLSSGAVKRYGDGHPPVDGSDGYVASKWAAEGLLRDAAKRAGLPVFIHRPAPTLGDRQTGDDDTITSDELLRLAKAISLRPDPMGLNGTGHFAPIDQISNCIVDTVLQPSAQSQDGVQIIEHAGTKTLSMGEFANLCEQLPELKELPTAKVLQWFGQAKKQGLKQFLTALEVEFSDDKGDTVVMSR